MIDMNSIFSGMIVKEHLGGYNDIPPNWTEITAHEYAIAVQRNSIFKNERRQISSLEGRLPVHLMIFHDMTGVASSAEYKKIVDDQSPHGRYDYETKFFRFGCDHLYKEVSWNRDKYGNQYSCDHLWKCEKCGREMVVNSGD